MNYSHPDADTLPTEKWAVYSCYPTTRKLTGKLDFGIQETLYVESLLNYIHDKHNICDAKNNMINMESLKSYLKTHLSWNVPQLQNNSQMDPNQWLSI